MFCSLQVSRVFEPSPQIIPDSDWLKGGVLFHPRGSGVCVCVCVCVRSCFDGLQLLVTKHKSSHYLKKKNFLKHLRTLLTFFNLQAVCTNGITCRRRYTRKPICYQRRVRCEASRFFTSCVQFEFLSPFFSVQRLDGWESLREGGGGFTLHLPTNQQLTNHQGRET